jgi:hypothetical protein
MLHARPRQPTLKQRGSARWPGILRPIATVLFSAALAAQSSDPQRAVAEAETLFADASDAHYIVATIDSGLFATYHGKDRASWVRVFQGARGKLLAGLAAIPEDKLSPGDLRAVGRMRAALPLLPEDPSSTVPAPTGNCASAVRPEATLEELHESLYSCFGERAEHLQFEGRVLNRVAALDLLGDLPDAGRRKALFSTFLPLWKSINGEGQPGSPYRRLLALSAARPSQDDSEIAQAAKTLAVNPAQVESWLEQILDAWRQATSDRSIEPWDFFYTYGAVDRSLAPLIPVDSLERISERYYRDLGIDLAAHGVLHDSKPRPGKAPLAYTDFVTVGRTIDNVWHPSVVRVSTNNARGGLGQLNEFIHEDGHAAHMLALHTRPAFMDLGDDLYLEAFADVASWSSDEPAWQRKYLGKAAPQGSSRLDTFCGVMLDIAWGLFELRLSREPNSDPNAIWTDITSRYLHIVPHPELSWWALRVQLVHRPGYMINYGLGAVLTADLRAHIRQSIGPFDTGNPRWFPWLAEHLLHFGTERETSELLRDFLGRPVTPDALLAELRRLGSERHR